MSSRSASIRTKLMIKICFFTDVFGHTNVDMFFLTSTGGHCVYISIRIYSGLYKLPFWCGKYQLSWHGRN